jgi:hypothetical protein
MYVHKLLLSAFTIKGAKDCVYTQKFLHPMILKNDYMNFKDYNLMKSFKNLFVYL